MDSQNKLSFHPGSEVTYQGEKYFIKKVIDLSSILLQHSSEKSLVTAPISQLLPLGHIDERPFSSPDVFTDEQWNKAEKRYAIIEPILFPTGDEPITEQVVRISLENNIHYTTIYRWLKRYEQSGELSSLIPETKSGGKGLSRLKGDVDAVIEKVLEDCYLTKGRISIEKTYMELKLRCRDLGLKPPHLNTLRNRILALSDEVKMTKRYGKKISNEHYKPHEKSYPYGNYPLESVQIDHTPLDILCVGEDRSLVIGRPWLTVAIDSYSRMILGYYISFDAPSFVSVGMCVANSILPKEGVLMEIDLKGEWPCWGIMKEIYTDNGADFKSASFQKACSEYSINLRFRPGGRPNFGGIIERMMGNFATKLHDLPGTTFSNTVERSGYESEKKAVLTIHELDKWLLHLIVNIYHVSYHKGIMNTPLAQFKAGLLGNGKTIGTGLPKRILNEKKLRIDFLPYFERTIQEYGVKIDHICYYSDVMRKWIHSYDAKTQRSRTKRKFIFKRDPRDISLVYFWEPELKEYFTVNYRNLSHPPLTLWEYREALRTLEAKGKANVNEDLIFSAYQSMKEIEQGATRSKQRNSRLKKDYRAKISKETSKAQLMGDIAEEREPDTKSYGSVFNKIILPFDELEHGTFE
ncbi:Mu transposase C-terminal domain-containing protein [Pedobacter sp. Hv1]|uniref:Mu transposase C-terminal domain-containing protein n=1 Tax=Pedobacter sp. Hv1 TaxID=1740090 RepID=UPI0006D8C517|nr:Mu transposase C-terminal domain-containing protein [Pedobacter sp. Hv1]KQB99194.1 hypothetical protein AQF98_16580 [Pedobacter sp. Hv1]